MTATWAVVLGTLAGLAFGLAFYVARRFAHKEDAETPQRTALYRLRGLVPPEPLRPKRVIGGDIRADANSNEGQR